MTGPDPRTNHDGTITGAEPVIVLRDVAIGYGDGAVVSGLDFTLTTGEMVALVGPNGSGKSTLVRGVLGLADVLDGEVELFGRPAAAHHQRHRLGYVPQRHTVIGGIPTTVREVVTSGRLRRSRWRPDRADDRAAVTDALTTVGLADHAERVVAELSGGQQRRVLIARALAGGADVLLMDEPMAGVDLDSQEALAATITALVRRGTTVLLVAHELGPLEPVVSRVVVLRHGRIEFDGAPGDVPARRFGGHDHEHDEPDVAPSPLGWAD
jgi:zinc transport system ATP-binding protein